MLSRSASTSQIDPASPTTPFETANPGTRPVSTGTGLSPRPSDAGLVSDISPPMMSPSSTRFSTSSTSKPPVSSAEATAKGTGAVFRGTQQQQQQTSLLLDPPSTCWWYPKKSTGLPDFVLISEFSEVEGPRAVMTIPDNIVDLTRDSYSSHKQRSQESSDASNATLSPDTSGNQVQEEMFDTHEFVLRITSADQQAREASGAFHIPEDIEVHISDPERGYWAYVHHFTLFDINARGFVRPFSVSYITRDPYKVLAHYEEMRHKFSRAALYFKTGNYTLFRQDLTKKLQNLNYTNNLLSEAPLVSSMSTDSPPMPAKPTLPSESSQNTLTASPSDSSEHPLNSKSESEAAQGLSEQQQADLESIKEAIETATHIISVLEHYSVDGQPLLGHIEDGNEGPQSSAPLSDLSPMTSSENLAALAAGRPTVTDPSLFLGSSSRPGSKVRHKASIPNVSGTVPPRILDSAGVSGMVGEGLTAPLPHLLGLQQEQSRKNSVVSDYDSLMYEAPEFEAQYVTTLYPIDRDEVIFRPLRELCVATMVWNSSIQFHLGIKKIKDILKDFQADSQLLGEALDNTKRMYPTSSSLTLGHRFLINFRNPDFNKVTAHQTLHQETPVPLMELLEGISTANVPSEDGHLDQEVAQGSSGNTTTRPKDSTLEDLQPEPTMDAEDADDEQTGYDSLDDAVSFFTAATGMATHTETPIRDGFAVAPLDRSARVAEWHQEQQTIHHAKRSGPTMPSTEGAAEQIPWTFSSGVTHGESSLASGFNKAQHRHSAQSGISAGVGGPGPLQALINPSIILETLQKDPTISKHLVFALLSGQKVCIMGQTGSEAKVRGMVSVLSTFLPHVGYPSREEQLIEHQRQVVSWYQGSGLLQVDDMEKYSLVGVDSSKIDPKFLEADICILDYDTFVWVHGRQYTDGILLESIFRSLNLFSEDLSFLAYADAKLFEILLKAFLYYHLVFHGRLYQGGLLSYPGAQSFYSSGASDDGEAFSHHSNFRSSRQSPMTPRSSALSRGSKRNTSTYPSSTNFGSTTLFRGSAARSASVSSHESSDVDRPMSSWTDPKSDARRLYAEDSRNQLYERNAHGDKHRNRVDVSEDESAQNGGQMQFTTSQGMRKWKRWFEYWSAKSVAMIDPALAAFGRPDSATGMDTATGSSNRRKHYGSRRSSPSRRSRNSSNHHHQSPGRNREAREREKGRDRERERDRDRKTTFDHFSNIKEKAPLFSSSDSEVPQSNGLILRGNMEGKEEKDMAAHGTENMDNRLEYSRMGDTHTGLAEALTPMMSSIKNPGLRRLKPKRPLTLHGSLSKSSQQEQGRKEQIGGQTLPADLVKLPSSESATSPPHSATFRSLAGALRAMSFGPSTNLVNAAEATSADSATGRHLESPPKSHGRLSVEEQRSPRSSREFSDSIFSHKDMKRRGSARAKAKAWFKAKRKRRSRLYDVDNPEHESREADERKSELSDEEHHHTSEVDEVNSNQEHSPRTDIHAADADKDQNSQTQEVGSKSDDQRHPPKSAHVGAESASPIVQKIPVLHSYSSVDLTEAIKAATIPEGPLPLEVPLTLEEIAAMEPTTRPQSRVLMMPTVSAATLNAVSSSNGSSRISSANGSRITSPLASSFSTDPRQRMDSIAGVAPSSKESSALTKDTMDVSKRTDTVAVTNPTEMRSEFDDSELDRRWDLGKESATEYETSMETFVNDRTNGMSRPGTSNRRSVESSGRPSLDATTSASNAAPIVDTTTKASSQQDQALTEKTKYGAGIGDNDKDTVTLTEEEELAVREMIGGVTGSDDWTIVVHLATMVDEYERSKGSDDAGMD
ncbi:hypothetical protein BGX28_010216 [Mortierella sp. GBA30]|nr:hypothetical protein BGX28_010216 [Mortierella sp. GBA30]